MPTSNNLLIDYNNRPRDPMEGFVKYSVYQVFHLYTETHRLFYIGLRHLTGKLTIINGLEIFEGTESSEVNIKQTLLNVGQTKRFEHYIVEGLGPNDFYVRNIRKVGDIDSWNYLTEEWRKHKLDRVVEFRKQFVNRAST